MLKYALIFLLVGIVAALFGFTGIAGASLGIAKVLAFIALALFAIFLVMGLAAGKRLAT